MLSSYRITSEQCVCPTDRGKYPSEKVGAEIGVGVGEICGISYSV